VPGFVELLQCKDRILFAGERGMPCGIAERSTLITHVELKEDAMRKRTIFVLAVAFSVTVGLAVATQTNGTNSGKQTSQSATHTTTQTVHHRMGTVDSVTANELILDHTWKGKEEKTKFTLNTGTKKEANVEKGDHVVVYYHVENGHRIATEVKASGTQPKTETKKT
jgi:uncharacterized membrane protein